ncbi:hypothetical protein P3S68_033342 [Capsicum galapagoense]
MATTRNQGNGPVNESSGSTPSAAEDFGVGVIVDASHPLCLAPGDTSGISLISFQLTGTDNYSLWSRSMRIALLGRNKLGLVDGSWKKERFHDKFWNQWERCNAVVLSWLMNSVSQNLVSGIVYASDAYAVWMELKKRFDKIDGSHSFNLHREIVTLVQGTSSISVYFSKVKDLWNEIEALVPLPSCNCDKSKDFFDHVHRQKLYQFLMGLNDSYIQARSQILLMTPLPSINQAYSMLVSDECQKGLAATSGVLGAPPVMSNGIGNYDSTALYSSRPNTVQRYKKNYNVQCDFCKMKGHAKENCYKIIGYPNDRFKKRGGGSNSGAHQDHTSIDNQSMMESRECAKVQDQPSTSTAAPNNQMQMPCFFTKDQYDQIVSMLNNVSNTTSMANTAGMNTTMSSRDIKKGWIIDTGATNHMVADPDLLTSYIKLDSTKSKRVFLPTGDVANVTHVGTSMSSLPKLKKISNRFLTMQIAANSGLCDLKYLEELSLSRNRFTGKLPPCLGNVTFLRVIDLTDNQFTGNIASSPLSSLLSLEYLLIANNNFEIPISFESFANHSKLKFVSASENSVITFQIGYCINNSKLGQLHLDGNAFTGSLQLPFLPNLKTLDIANNKIRGQLHPNIGSIFPNLFVSIMSNNMLEGLLPSSFADMKNLEWLDLSYNKLEGELPIRLARKGSNLFFLRLSNNMLKGEIFPVSDNINNFEYLYLDGNNFSGPIPQKLSTALFLSSLDLSENNLSGNIPAMLGNISSLKYLALSRNHLKGHIPPDYCRLEGLEALDLSENKLVGVIPSCFSAFQNLKHLTSDITILLLKGNRLQGTIPPLLCHARYLRMLDISHSNLSGPIPHCLGNITQQQEGSRCSNRYILTDAYVTKVFGGDPVIGIESSIKRSLENMLVDTYAWVGAEFTTKYNTYSYEGRMVDYMCGIDLSYNQLSGEIPKELSNLTQIHALNLSHDHLTGAIPSEFSNLQNIESLNLSYNNLTGSIPTQLLKLTALAVFTMAHNNLTGRTPQRSAQFATFTESSYEGNHFLCGLPLNISCTESKEIPIYPPAPNCCEDDVSFLDVEAFYISFLVAYANVAVAVVVVLWVNPYWRNVWPNLLRQDIDQNIVAELLNWTMEKAQYN